MATKTKAKKYPMAELKNRIDALAKLAAKSQKDGDYELTRAFTRDMADLQCIYDALRARNYACAMRIADRVDTAVRDEIPNALYNQMAKATGRS